MKKTTVILYCFSLESRIEEGGIIPKRSGLHYYNFVNLLRLGIVLLIFLGLPEDRQGVVLAKEVPDNENRINVIGQQMDCVQQQQKKRDVDWEDICYTQPRSNKIDGSRIQVINQMLDAVEQERAPSPPKATQYFNSPTLNRMNQPATAYDRWLEKNLNRQGKAGQEQELDGPDAKRISYKNWDGIQKDEISGPASHPEKNDSNLYSFFRNFDYGFTVESGSEPRYYVETVLPLYQSDDQAHTVFTHDRISLESAKDGTFSAGVGYRRLTLEDPIILGVNGFFDYQQQNSHYRGGLGFEIINDVYESRFNYYKALSPERYVDDHGERAVDGFDIELGAPLFGLSWLKLFGGYYSYDYDHSDDPNGWKARSEFKPFSFLTMNFETLDGYEGDRQYRLDGRFSFSFDSLDPKDVTAFLKKEDEPEPEVDLRDRLLDRVERDFHVRVEKWNDRSLPVVGNLNNVQMVVRFPGVNCGGGCLDNNSNGVAGAGDGFEIDFLLTNLTSQPATNVSYTNAAVSTSWIFGFNTSGILADAPAGGTTRTDDVEDLDLDIPLGTPDGTQFNITVDFSSDGQTTSLTFGPFTVGSITHNQVIDLL